MNEVGATREATLAPVSVRRGAIAPQVAFGAAYLEPLGGVHVDCGAHAPDRSCPVPPESAPAALGEVDDAAGLHRLQCRLPDGASTRVRPGSVVGRLGLRVVAEGVEDEETAAAVRAMGASLVQGYPVSRPLMVGTLDAWRAACDRDGQVTTGSWPSTAAPPSHDDRQPQVPWRTVNVASRCPRESRALRGWSYWDATRTPAHDAAIEPDSDWPVLSARSGLAPPGEDACAGQRIRSPNASR
jgi:hypothetical protein